MDRRHIIKLQGQEFVTYEGLLHEAHLRGLKAIRTEIVQLPDAANGQMAVVRATVELEGDRFFSGIGDASPGNVNSAIARHILRMAECVPLRAEILTSTGFRSWHEVRVGEQVLAYDLMDDRCKWVPLQAITQVNFPVPTVSLRSRSFALTCTSDHSWAIDRSGHWRHANSRTLRKTCDFKAGDSIIVAAPAEAGPHPLEAWEASLLGWLATDGNVAYRAVQQSGHTYGPYLRASIAQSKVRYLDELRDLVTIAGGSVTSYQPQPRDFGSHVSNCLLAHKFNLSTPAIHRLLERSGLKTWHDLPGLVLQLGAEARKAMLEAMLHGDGSCARSNSWTFGQKAKPGVSEAFELLATLEGHALGVPRMSSIGEVPVRQLRRNRHIATGYLRIEPAESQPVWCPTTEYGTWIMRLDGHITITGNTRAKARALRDAVDIGITAFEELGEGPGTEPAIFAPRNATERQIAKVAVEMARVGWSEKQGRDYLIQHFNKLSRAELTGPEISALIDHLVSLPGGSEAM